MTNRASKQTNTMVQPVPMYDVAEKPWFKREEFLSVIIETALDAIIAIDVQRNIVLFNSAAENIFGYTAEDILGHPIETLIPSRYRPQHPENVRSFGETESPLRQMGIQRVVSALRSNGEEFPAEASISQVNIDDTKFYTVIIRDVTERVKNEEERNQLQASIVQMQQALVQELSTPIIPISDNVMIMPLVGSVDTLRAQNVMETLLQGVEKHQAQFVILDITGVPIVDTQVANTLLQAAQAVQLLGAKVMLTGISPDIAQTLVGLGVDLSTITTYSTLQIGITFAMQMKNGSRSRAW